MNYLEELKNIVKVTGEFLDHDPVNPIIEFDYNKKIYKAAPRNTMPFIKEILIHYYKYSSILDRYALEHSIESTSYHRPIEFYDHVLSPSEIDNLSEDNVVKYILYYIEKNRFFESDVLYTMINHNISFMEALQKKIKEKCYRVVREYSDHHYLKQDLIFHETWNTSFYYHLLPPRRKIYFLNFKNNKCTCSSFKKYKTCIHLYKVMLFRCFYKYFNSIVLANDMTNYLLLNLV